MLTVLVWPEAFTLPNWDGLCTEKRALFPMLNCSIELSKTFYFVVLQTRNKIKCVVLVGAAPVHVGIRDWAGTWNFSCQPSDDCAIFHHAPETYKGNGQHHRYRRRRRRHRHRHRRRRRRLRSLRNWSRLQRLTETYRCHGSFVLRDSNFTISRYEFIRRSLCTTLLFPLQNALNFFL